MDPSRQPASAQAPALAGPAPAGAALDGKTLDLRHLAGLAPIKDGALLKATQTELNAALARARDQGERVVHILLPPNLDQLPPGLDRFEFLRQLDIPCFQGRAIDLRALPGDAKSPLQVRLDQAADLMRIDRLDGQRQQVLGGAWHQRKVKVFDHKGADSAQPLSSQSLPAYAYWRSSRSDRPEGEDLQSLNVKARFAGTQNPIVCRHLATAFWLARMDYLARKHTGDGKSAPNPALRFEDFFTSVQDIQDKVPASIEARWKAECTRSTDNHLVAVDRWNEFLQGRFKAMVGALAPGQAHACKPWLVMSANHAMYLELQVKRDADGQVHGVVLMHDPNVTGSYRRVRLDDPCAMACALEELLPRLLAGDGCLTEPLAHYFGEAAEDRVAMAVALPALYEQPGAREAGAPASAQASARRLGTSCAPARCTPAEIMLRLYTGLSNDMGDRVASPALDAAQRAALAHTRMDLPAEGGGRVVKSMLGQAIDYDDATMVRSLAAMAIPAGAPVSLASLRVPSDKDLAPVEHALTTGRGRALQALLQAAEDSGASVEDLEAFYASTRERTPALYRAAVSGDASAIGPWCDAVGSSRLYAPQKLQLLRAAGPDGTPALYAAARNSRLEALRALARGICNAGLDSASTLRLLEGRRFDGMTCLHAAMDDGQSEVVRALVDEAQHGRLSAQDRITFLTAPRMNGMSALSQAALSGHTEAVKAWTEGALRLLATPDVSEATRRQVLLGLRSDDDKAPTMLKLVGIADNPEHVKIAWGQCIARAPESQLKLHEKRALLAPINKLHLLPKTGDGKRG